MFSRRAFFGTSFSSLALAAMLHRDGYGSPGTWAPPDVAYAKTVLQAPAHLKLVEAIRAAQPAA